MKILLKILISTILISSIIHGNTFENIEKAINTNDLKKVRAIAKNSTDLNSTNQYGESLLHISARQGRQNIVSYLSNIIDVNIKNRSNATALHEACIKGNYISAKALIDRGAEVNVFDDYGDTPLHNASLRGSIKTVKLLVLHGADTNGTNQLGESALHNAARGGYTKIISYLLDKSAYIDNKNIKDETPLDIAKQRNKQNAIKLLIKRGAKQ